MDQKLGSERISAGNRAGNRKGKKLLVKQVKLRFKDFNASRFEARLNEIKIESLEKIGEWIVTCDSFAELEEKMDQLN